MRVILPSCAVMTIRRKFPSSAYTGFKYLIIKLLYNVTNNNKKISCCVITNNNKKINNYNWNLVLCALMSASLSSHMYPLHKGDGAAGTSSGTVSPSTILYLLLM